MKDAKQSTKDKAQKRKKDKIEKSQSFATATAKAASVSASKKNDSDDDKFDKHDFMNAFIKPAMQKQGKTPITSFSNTTKRDLVKLCVKWIIALYIPLAACDSKEFK
jgi:hypothetical protein